MTTNNSKSTNTEVDDFTFREREGLDNVVMDKINDSSIHEEYSVHGNQLILSKESFGVWLSIIRRLLIR